MSTRAPDRSINPFEVTKATDLDDAQIAATWVDLPSAGGFRSVIDPRSPVTRFVLGGKGSGRTHLLRYYSSRLQALRLHGRGSDALATEGYVGVYLNSSALNPGRFFGKGQNDDTWNAVFGYYFDLSFALRMLFAVDELCRACEEGDEVSASLRDEVHRLFDEPPETSSSLTADLSQLLRRLDSSINHAALTRELRVVVGATPGRLIFGTARALGRVAVLKDIQFALLLDEFENFSELQQRYVHTLIREKTKRVSFLVGARTFGVRTTWTLSGERNRVGSEFETIELDSFFRRRHADYRRFCRSLVARRLNQAGFLADSGERDFAAALGRSFVHYPTTAGGGDATAFVRELALDRKHLVRLREQLKEYRPGAISDKGIAAVLQALHCPEDPVIEKICVYLLYRSWHGRGELNAASRAIEADRRAFLAGDRGTAFATTVGHFRIDMVAQLLQEYRQSQRYLGFAEYLVLSAGLPRGLLVILKHVFRWAVFNGEKPFVDGHAITEESQRAGVEEAGRWFLTDLAGIGPHGEDARDAVGRLGRFLQALRFSDKPTESSACTVSLDPRLLSTRGRATVDHCVQSSFLLSVSRGHRDRSTGLRKQKLQLHPMLCPRWRLPTGRRGVVELSTEEAGAIFDAPMATRLRTMIDVRLARMNAPFRFQAGSDESGFRFNG